VWQNLEIVREARPEYVLILAGDHVYKMDYARLLADHIAAGAAATVACIEVPLNQAREFGVMSVDGADRITAFTEKPAQPQPIPGKPGHALASMGIYVFDTEFLCQRLAADAADADSRHDFGHDIIPRLVARGHHVLAHRFTESCVNMVGDKPYWRDVGTVDAYWEANLDLTHVVPELNLYDDEWPILSLQRQEAPAKFVFDDEGRRGSAMDSLVSGGCIVSGATVRRSILFSKVRVAEGSLIEDSVILPAVQVGRRVVLKRTIVDKGCVLPDGFRAGLNLDEDRARFHVSPRGVVLITPEMLAAPRPGELPPPGQRACDDDSAPMPLHTL
jgi:glucose-1-phosphate adenylyltransferase